ncbi:hypothetical protein EDC05_002656 [Coemansia umbellata]|uniref:HTH APSES-type domain-containing protein n=1 Tax=Coemansia umbellata TaxID=1424467 RepID=A0ABQ8PPF4_9FUNG|nr:hypothetical protein EDC05_002656 [Coemansia umbellata]
MDNHLVDCLDRIEAPIPIDDAGAAACSGGASPTLPPRAHNTTPTSTDAVAAMPADAQDEANQACASDRSSRAAAGINVICLAGCSALPKGEQASTKLRLESAAATAVAEEGAAAKASDNTAPAIPGSLTIKEGIPMEDGIALDDGGFDFSFHDLMDAELMSLNELDKLWATSNPSGSSLFDDAYMRSSALEPIPEAAIEDTGDTASSMAGDAKFVAVKRVTDSAAANGFAESALYAEGQSEDDHSELPTKLTRKLLALAASPTSVSVNDTETAQLHTRCASDAVSPAASATKQTPAPLVDGRAHLQMSPKQPLVLASAPGSTSLPATKLESTAANGEPKPLSLDSLESTKVLAGNTEEHEETISASSTSSNRVILPDPFADISPTAMVATKMPVSPRIVLTIVETVPVYMTVITTTEPAAECQGKWIVRRHRLLRLVENGYVNASSLLLAGGVASEQERSIVLSLEVGRFKWRRPQSKLYGTWIPLPRARALAATCSLNHRLGPFLNDNLEAYFPAPLPTSFIRHLIMPFFSDPSMLLSSSQPTVESAEGAGMVDDTEPSLVTASESAPPRIVASNPADGTVLAAPGASNTTATSAAASAAAVANADFAREAGLGIEFQTLANSAMSNSMHQPTQSISRSSTFGATARGAPSPSIIQTLATRSGPFSFAGAAKTIFGSDDRQLQSFLQLLSVESPMLGTSMPSDAQAEQSSRPSSPDGGAMDVEASDSLISPGRTRPEVKAVINGLAQSKIVDGDSVGLSRNMFDTKAGALLADKSSNIAIVAAAAAIRNAANGLATGGTDTGSAASSPRVNIDPDSRNSDNNDNNNSHDEGSDKSTTPKSPLPGEQETTAFANNADATTKGQNRSIAAPLAEEATEPTKSISSAADISFADPMECDSVENHALDLSMVLPGGDDDMDMICCSTPPSPPPPPPHTPPRQRRLSSAPLLLSRPASPCLSDSIASSEHDEQEQHLEEQDGQKMQPRRDRQGIGAFNARLAQSMEAFGFTGTAKTSLLLRLRAAAAAKSTGRQQAIAPYMLYRSSAAANAVNAVGGSVASGSNVTGAAKRVKSFEDDEGMLNGGVRKRARVIRVPRSKPLVKQAAANAARVSGQSTAARGNGGRGRSRGPSVPDASVVMRIASAIYNHTLNMATLAQSQRQAAEATANGGSAGSAQTPTSNGSVTAQSAAVGGGGDGSPSRHGQQSPGTTNGSKPLAQQQSRSASTMANGAYLAKTAAPGPSTSGSPSAAASRQPMRQSPRSQQPDARPQPVRTASPQQGRPPGAQTGRSVPAAPGSQRVPGGHPLPAAAASHTALQQRPQRSASALGSRPAGGVSGGLAVRPPSTTAPTSPAGGSPANGLLPRRPPMRPANSSGALPTNVQRMRPPQPGVRPSSNNTQTPGGSPRPNGLSPGFQQQQQQQRPVARRPPPPSAMRQPHPGQTVRPQRPVRLPGATPSPKPTATGGQPVLLSKSPMPATTQQLSQRAVVRPPNGTSGTRPAAAQQTNQSATSPVMPLERQRQLRSASAMLRSSSSNSGSEASNVLAQPAASKQPPPSTGAAVSPAVPKDHGEGNAGAAVSLNTKSRERQKAS